MMRKILPALLALAPLSLLQAVPVDCNTLSTLQQYVTAVDGCFVQDKLFTNFVYTGGGSVGASDVDVDVVFNVLPGQDIHGFTFTPLAGSPVWTSGFTLSYTIAVSPPSPNISIVSAKTQGNFGNLPNTATLQTAYTNGVSQSVSFVDESDVDVFPGVASLGVTNTATIPTGQFLISVENTFTQAFVPEPASILLSGLALLGFGVWTRRRRNRTE